VIETTVRIERPEGTAVATGVPAQYDLSPVDVKSDEQGNRDFVWLDVYLAYVPSSGVRLRDVLFDEQNSDPLTGAAVKMRVAGVEVFQRDHVEIRAQQVVGT
jgi:hypothetical protein